MAAVMASLPSESILILLTDNAAAFLELFHVVEIVGRNGISAGCGFFQHGTGVYKSDLFKMNHGISFLYGFFRVMLRVKGFRLWEKKRYSKL